jgi:hypothetical protein
MEKLKIPKVSSSISRTITPENDQEIKTEITEQDLIDLKKARENPKLNSMVKHIDGLIEKSRKVKTELTGMVDIFVDLKNQCKVQEQEVGLLDVEQKRVTEETTELKTKVEVLFSEKQALEKKLEELKLENDELEAFLAQNKGLQDQVL